MGKKIKVCPNKSCGHHNSTKAFVCEKCDIDITTVAPVDEDSLNKEIQTGERIEPKNESQAVRICEECGHQNPVNIGVCEECGEDISGVIPTILEKEIDGEIHYDFCSLDGTYAYRVLKESIIIGRENEMKEYLADKLFVSRTQAEITLVDGKLFVRNLTEKKSTFINNIQITDDALHEINDGDEVGLGGFESNGDRAEKAAFFIVRIGNCDG